MLSHRIFMSRAGYRHHRKNRSWPGGYTVLYEARAQGLDDTSGRWACVCETHGTILNCETQKVALAHLLYADWCEKCQNETDHA